MDNQCMMDYPYASAYLLGFFDSTTAVFDNVYEDHQILSMIELLEKNISMCHPRWLRTEMYYRGMDLKEAFIDNLSEIDNMTELEINMKLRHIIKKTGHNPKIINLVHKIGKEVFCDQTNNGGYETSKCVLC